MKKSVLSIALLTGVALTAQANQPSEAEARGLVKDYMSQLKPALMKSMKEGGPVNSIDVCHTKAPQIAHDLTQKSGWKINRVSLKPRAVNAKPDAWEKTVLERFDAQLAEGKPIKGMEVSQVIIMNGEKQYRYMKAIPTAAVCLNCHGTDVQPAVKKAISEYYPDDQAVGYSKGQIRGAFSFTKAL